MINKINIYIFTQIIKYFSLVFFIFISISWILQLTRLFTISNFMQINVLNIIYLSIFLIPNLLTVIIPFILIFGILLCFIKLNRDKELISILSLGLELKPIKISLIYFLFFVLFFHILLSFYIAPKIYENYKLKEFELRNTLNFDNMIFSNFIKINNNTILDFKKNNNFFEDIYISFYDENENIIYAKKGFIIEENNGYKFQLSNGFKISITNNEQIEKLEFLNYIFEIKNNSKGKIDINDINTFTIFDDFNSKSYINIAFKITDIVLLIFIIYFFYYNNIKKMNFSSKNNIFFVLICLFFLISNQILENSEIKLNQYIVFIGLIFFLITIVNIIKQKYE